MKERTLKEILNNPESMTEEETKDMHQLFEAIYNLGKACEPYNIKVYRKNTPKVLSKHFYQQHFIMAATLEAFWHKNEIIYRELNETIANYIPKDFLYDIPITRIELFISKMVRLGFIEPIQTDNKYAPKFRITDDGIKAYQDHRFQNLATSSFFSYQTYKLNQKANRMSWLMLIATCISILVAILSVIVTISTAYL